MTDVLRRLTLADQQRLGEVTRDRFIAETDNNSTRTQLVSNLDWYVSNLISLTDTELTQKFYLSPADIAEINQTAKKFLRPKS